MKKSELIAEIAETGGITKTQAGAVLDQLVDLVISELKSTGESVLPDLGKFVVKDRKARMGVNPATGAKIQIAAKKTLKFRVAKRIKDAALPKAKKKAAK